MNPIHRFVPGAGPVLLLLHGTGGDETSLLDLGRGLCPGAALLSPRGSVLENGTTPRFFRRLAEGVFDEKDLVQRTHELAEYGFDAGNVVAVGYSNGANIAASTLLLRPDTLRGAVLLRAMVPLVPAIPPALGGTPVFLASGRHDPIVPAENVERLAAMLRQAGADVSLRWSEGGHPLASAEIDAARAWLAKTFPTL